MFDSHQGSWVFNSWLYEMDQCFIYTNFSYLSKKKKKKKEENSLIGLSNKKVKFAKMKFIARVNGIPQGHWEPLPSIG